MVTEFLMISQGNASVPQILETSMMYTCKKSRKGFDLLVAVVVYVVFIIYIRLSGLMT